MSSTKIGYAIMHYHWGQKDAKKETWPLLTAERTSSKKASNLHGWLERHHGDLSESCQPNRDLCSVGTKLKENIFKTNNQISHLFEISNQMFIMMTQNIIARNLSADVFRTPSSI